MAIITISDVRAEGLTVAAEPSATDDRIALAILIAHQYVATQTRQTFEPVFYGADAPLLVDGSGTPDLLLPIFPMVLIQAIESGNLLSASDLVVYQRVAAHGDDRFNPKIAKKAISTLGFGGVGIYSGGQAILRAPIWLPYQLGVQLAGVFGFVEPDRAWLDLSQFAVSLTTVVQAAAAGYGGNLHSIQVLGDGATPAVSVTQSAITTAGPAGTIPTGGTAYVFHFQPGVSRVSDFEAAVAGIGALLVKVPSTRPGSLLGAADAVPATLLHGSPPPLIKKTALRLVMRYWRQMTDAMEKIDRSTGQIQSESTDGHSYSLTGVLTSTGLTGDPVIDDVLAMYRRRYGGSTRGLWQ